MSTVFKQLGFWSTVRRFAIVIFAAITLGISYETIAWYLVRTHGAHVELSSGRSVELSVSAFYLANGVVSYSENGKQIGQTILSNDFLYDPLAIFPCGDQHSVVCVSWPDTFDAAFTIDFSKRLASGACIAYRLRGIVVDSSDFEVRACTPEEVAYVRNFIRTADLKSFAACTRWGASAETQDQKESMLVFFTWATSPNDWRDPMLKNAKPLLLPEELPIADNK